MKKILFTVLLMLHVHMVKADEIFIHHDGASYKHYFSLGKKEIYLKGGFHTIKHVKEPENDSWLAPICSRPATLSLELLLSAGKTIAIDKVNWDLGVGIKYNVASKKRAFYVEHIPAIKMQKGVSLFVAHHISHNKNKLEHKFKGGINIKLPPYEG